MNIDSDDEKMTVSSTPPPPSSQQRLSRYAETAQLFVDYFIHGRHDVQRLAWTRIREAAIALHPNAALIQTVYSRQRPGSDEEWVTDQDIADLEDPILCRYVLWTYVVVQPKLLNTIMASIAPQEEDAKARLLWFANVMWPIMLNEYLRGGRQGQSHYDPSVADTVSLQDYLPTTAYRGVYDFAVDVGVVLATGISSRIRHDNAAKIAYDDVQRKLVHPMYNRVETLVDQAQQQKKQQTTY
jgi:hypothetical protein